jgi:hypothetical protein
MRQIRLPENIGKLTRTTTTTITLEPSRVNVGAFQYSNSSNLTLNTVTIGVDGVESAIQNWKLYYVYAVAHNKQLKIIASLSDQTPAGFLQSKLVGYFDTDGSGQILAASNHLIGCIGDSKSAFMTEEEFRDENGPGWILSDGRDVAGSRFASLRGVSVVPDARGMVLRGKNNGRSTAIGDVDGERPIGAQQVDTMQRHRHSINDPGHSHGYERFELAPGAAINNGGNQFANVARTTGGSGSNISVTDPSLSPTYGTPRAGEETRMRNIAVNHFIKVN